MNLTQAWLTWAAAVAAGIAAAFWLRSTTAKVLSRPGVHAESFLPIVLVETEDNSGNTVDLLATFTLQAKWNRRAAAVTALAAALQALSLVFGAL